MEGEHFPEKILRIRVRKALIEDIFDLEPHFRARLELLAPAKHEEGIQPLEQPRSTNRSSL